MFVRRHLARHVYAWSVMASQPLDDAQRAIESDLEDGVQSFETDGTRTQQETSESRVRALKMLRSEEAGRRGRGFAYTKLRPPGTV